MQKKLSMTNILAYASTDTAGNLLYCTLTSFILYFYTDVFGISVGAAGTILLIARVIDSLDAPIWGLIIDHTHSKYGQSRPWFLWLAAPFGIFLTLSFLSPELSTTQKGIYALVTYLVTGIIYTGISTPITSILPNLSSDSNERVKLNSYRMVGGNIGYFVTASFTLPLVAFFGGGNDQKGFAITAAIYSVIGILMFVFAFAKTQEVNSGPVETQSIPIKDSFKSMMGNWPWIIVVSANVMYWLGNTVRTSTVIYYAQYNLGHQNYASLLNGLVLFQVVGNILIPFMVRKFSKGQTLIIGFTIATIGQILMGFVGDSFTLIAAAWIFTSIGTGIAVSMPFAMLSDTVDYGEWKTGIRSAGFLTAIGSAFCIKMGSGLGGFLPSKIMAASGYVAHHQQTASALAGIKFSFIWLPAICFMIGAVIMLMYPKFERREEKIKQDLLSRIN
ncbi:MFS transporter [Weissella hellenica]|uniref:MFS transporter n=1 Tax=Weissella hellenica TaxID=46256 RepID=A0A4Y4G6U1_WEIHE|nr:MFS transporter [Weissella hellenica]NKY66135.1 MFS transporter [Weissella hellenica]GED35591.1 sodium:solute symporter [Weissella hellenica]SCB79445.1 sugar (Glycoside-Pentoside-Hexuronide) transporter [Weissella hellenica]